MAGTTEAAPAPSAVRNGLAEVVILIAYVIGTTAYSLFAMGVGDSIQIRVAAGVVVLAPILLLHRLARTDPVGWISSMGPAVALGSIGFVAGSSSPSN